MLLYADDTILYMDADTVEAAAITNQRALDKVCAWCSNKKDQTHVFGK